MSAFDPHPIVLWELTRACDLHCRGCPTGSRERRDPNELTTYETYKTIDLIAAVQPRELVITGGDPLERRDLPQIIDYARRRGLDPALVLSPTSQLTLEALDEMARAGLTRVIFSIDGATHDVQELVHGVRGTFAATLRALRWAECAGLQREVNTLVTRRNAGDLEAIADLVRSFAVARWNVHFLVPIGGAAAIEMITAEETERVFERLDRIRERETFALRVVEAPHFRRFLVERRLRDALAGERVPDRSRALLDAARDGARGFVYISHAGDVRPSEFAPQSAGNLRYRPLGAIYRASDLFVALRDVANLKGKCGRCEYRELCGGSRARAWAMTGDLFGSDPLCAWEKEAV